MPLAVAALSGVAFVAACSESPSSKEPENVPVVLYQDYANFEFDNWKFEFKSAYCTSTQSANNQQVKVKYKYENAASQTRIMELKKLTMTRESDGATYSTYYNLGSTLASPKVKLEAGIKADLEFKAVIPTHTSKDKYRMDFTLNDKNFSFHLYSKPDELRKDCTVSRYLDGEELDSGTFKEDRLLRDLFYEWHSGDWGYACRKWYIDPEMKVDAESSLIKDGLKIYGAKVPMLSYVENDDDPDAVDVQSIYMSCYAGGLYIPKSFDGKRVAKVRRGALGSIPETSPWRISGSAWEAHIPSGIVLDNPFASGTGISSVKYGGSAEEWAEAYSGTPLSDLGIEIEYNQSNPT